MKQMVAMLVIGALAAYGDVPSTTENFSYKHDGETKALSEMVQDGKIVLGDGTFVYEGEDGATLDYPITNAVEDVYEKGDKARTVSGVNYYKAIYQPKGLVYDIHNDLILPQGIKADQGAFIKTGPGTLWLPTANSLTLCKRLPNRMEIAEDGSWSPSSTPYGNPTISTLYPFEAQESGTAPANGFALFNVFGGGFRLGTTDTKASTTVWTLDQKGPVVYLGGLSAQSGEQEPDVLVELMGGKVAMNCSVTLGYLHGLSKTTPNGPAKSVLRIHENGYWATGGGKAFTMGDNSASSDISGRGSVSNGIIRVEVLGGTFNFNSGLSAGNSQYSSSEIFCSNGVVQSGTTIWKSDVAFGSAPYVRTGVRKHAVSTFDFTGPKAKLQTGVIIAGYGNSASSYDYASTYLNFSDGATLEVACLTNGGNRAAHTINRLTLDGGILHEQPAVSPADHFVDGRWEIRLGAAGGTIAMHNTDKVHPVLSAIASADGVTDGGLVVAADDDAAVLELTKASDYVGPTLLQKGILRFSDEGALPAATSLQLAGGTLEVAGSDVTVASLQFTAPSGISFSKGAKLVVTDSLTVAEPTVVEVAMSGATKGDRIDIIQVPETSAAALANIIFHTADGSELAVIGKTVTTAGGVATLTAEFDDPRTMDANWVNSDGGLWATAANWEGEIVPYSRPGVKATFATAASADGTAVTLKGATMLGSLVLSATKGYDFRNGSFVFDNDGLGGEIAVSGGGEWRVRSALTLNEDTEVNLAAQTDSITIAGVIGGMGSLIFPSASRTVRFAGGANAANDPDRIRITGDGTTVADDGADTETELGGFRIDGDIGVLLDVAGSLTVSRGIVGNLDDGEKPSLRKRNTGTFVLDGGETGCSLSVWNYHTIGGETVVKPGATLEGRGNLYLGFDNVAASTALASPVSFTIDGGDAKASTVSFNGFPSEAGVTNRLTVRNGGRLTVGGSVTTWSSKAVSGKSCQLGVMTIDDGLADIAGTFYMCSGANTGNRVELNENGVIRAAGYHGAGTTAGDVVTPTCLDGAGIFADGGAFQPCSHTATAPYLWPEACVYVGAKGLKIDLTHMKDDPEKTSNFYFAIRGGLRHDPSLGEATDGGVTLTGDGVSYALLYFFYDTMSTFTGPFTVGNGGHLAFGTHYNDSKGTVKRALNLTQPLIAKPGAMLSLDTEQTYLPVFSSLTLGEADATMPVILRCATGAAGVFKTGALTVNSPVSVGVGKASAESIVLVAGTYVVGYYDASQSAVDLSKFSGISTIGMRATFSTEAGSGDCAGLTAIKMTVVADASVRGDAKWDAVQSGGDWSEGANWEDGIAPDSPALIAEFKPATAADVSVTVDKGISIGGILIDKPTDGSFGYAIGGDGPLSFNGSAEAFVRNDGGVSRLDAATADYFGNLKVQVYTGATQHIGSATLKGLKGSLSAGSGMTSSNTGLIVLDDAGEFAGRLLVGYGCVELDSLDFVDHPNRLALRYGLLRYTGGDKTLPGYLSDEGTASFSAFEISKADTTLTLLGNTASGNGSHLLKTGAGTMVLGGTDGFTWKSAKSGTGSWNNYQPPTSGICPLQVAEGLVKVGAQNDPANAPLVTVVASQPSTGTNFCIAVGTARKAGSPTLRLDNGTLLGTNCVMFLGYQGANDPASVYTYEQNGGSLRVGSVEMGNGTSTSSSWLDVKPTKRFIVNGGTAEVARTFGLGAADGKATLELNGGELTAETIVPMTIVDGTTYTGTVKFNGGTFAPTGAGMSGGTQVEVGANGGTISTSKLGGESFTLGCAVKGSGTLVKTGANTLVIDAEVAPMTTVSVAEGALAVGPNANVKGAVALAGGMLSADGRSVGMIAGAGEIAGAVTVNGFRPAKADAPTLTFTGTLTIASKHPTIDLSAYEGAIAEGASIPLARVTSIAGLPAKGKIVGVDSLPQGVRGVLRVTGGVLYADLIRSGLLMFIR